MRACPLLCLLACLLLVVGCPNTDDDDSSTVDDDDVVQDDDDAVDDDDSGADDDDSATDDDDAVDDDDSATDDDDVADDDDSSGDDDDSAQAEECTPDFLLPSLAPCQPVVSTPLALDDLMGNCPEGAYEFVTQGDWDDFLGSTCYAQPAADPLAGFDWAAANVVGTIQGASGSDATGGFHWVAQCADGSLHFADWLVGCGDGDGYYREAHFVSVDPLFAPMAFTGCVPSAEACTDVDD
jgi:hypothetical protein